MNVLETETWEHEGIEYTVKYVLDEYPDLSWLGEYTDSPRYDDRFLIVDREMNGDKGRNEYRFFECAYNLAEAQRWYTEHGYCKHDAYTIPRQRALKDYKRMEEYIRGDWHMVGIIVERADELCPDCGQSIEHSASLWGIASDDDEKYIESIIEDLIAEIAPEPADVVA